MGSPTSESAILSDEAKIHLQEMARLLNSEIGELVSDANPIREHFEAIHGQVQNQWKKL